MLWFGDKGKLTMNYIIEGGGDHGSVVKTTQDRLVQSKKEVRGSRVEDRGSWWCGRLGI